MLLHVVVLCSLFWFCAALSLDNPPGRCFYTQPQQIHLSYGADETQMIVTWTTFDLDYNWTDPERPADKQPLVRYGSDSLDMLSEGVTTLFVDGGNETRHLYIHRAVMRGLIPGHKYTLRPGADWSPKLAVYGDLGNMLAQSLGPLQEAAQDGVYDAVIHVGDFAYDFHDDNGRVGDEFMRQIEPLAAYIPYQTCPGNHERFYNFSHYENRFTMVSQGGGGNNHYWSYNIGPAHVLAFSTEFYHYKEYGSEQIKYQYQWLKDDLIEANKQENRQKHPWIITFGHRPFYGHDSVDDDIRLGDNITETERIYGLEELFYNSGVDLEVWGHEHNYMRLWPIYNNTVYNGSDSEPYRNPKAPVHIITGSAGSYMKQKNEVDTDPHYQAYSNDDYGYTVLTVVNGTHLRIQQMSVDKDQMVDDIYVIKEVHGSQAWK